MSGLYPSLEDMTVGNMANVSKIVWIACFFVTALISCVSELLLYYCDSLLYFFPQAQLAQQRQQAGPPGPAVPSAPYQPPPISATPGATATTVVAVSGAVSGGLYPSLEDYMGLELSRYVPVSVTIT